VNELKIAIYNLPLEGGSPLAELQQSVDLLNLPGMLANLFNGINETEERKYANIETAISIISR